MNLRALRLLLLALVVAEIALWFRGPQPKEHLADIAAATSAGKHPDWWDDAALGIHYAAGIDAVLLLILLGTSKWWSRPIADSATGSPENMPASRAGTLSPEGVAAQPPKPQAASRKPKYFWPLILAATLTCLALRLPLASKSLWWDEAWVIEQVSLGRWKPDSKQPDKVKFQAHDWSRCAWYYQKPTNHAPMSLLQKASITAWQKITHARRDQFSDLSARIPALAASCLAVILMGCLLRGWGRPGGGVAAAFVLAIHPWAIRYGVDARAYALVIPLCIAGMLAITRIIQTRGIKFLPWLGWGITEFLWLWAYPNAVLDISALNLVAVFFLWKDHHGKDRWSALFRLAATNVFAAICLIQVFLPNLMQARRWAGHEADQHVLNVDLTANTIWELLYGYDLDRPEAPPIAPQLVVAGALAILVISLLTLAWKRAHKQSLSQPSIVLASLMLSSLAFAGTTRILGSYFYPRFVIALLPVVIIEFCINQPTVDKQTRWLSIVGNVLMAVLFVGLWPLPLLLTRPYAPLHDVASFVQADSAKQSPPPLVACYGLGREVLPVYYPTCLPVENAAGLQKVRQRAQAEHRALYIIQGYDSFNRARLPDGFPILDDRSRFTELKTFLGIEPDFTFHVFRAL